MRGMLEKSYTILRVIKCRLTLLSLSWIIFIGEIDESYCTDVVCVCTCVKEREREKHDSKETFKTILMIQKLRNLFISIYIYFYFLVSRLTHAYISHDTFINFNMEQRLIVFWLLSKQGWFISIYMIRYDDNNNKIKLKSKKEKKNTNAWRDVEKFLFFFF